ncbi:hypothetical protein QZH41_005995 [Actinostola sp. cb2023]|nr:hypothetical protein QZH41_005995 [Actinostola sp. cb2023]
MMLRLQKYDLEVTYKKGAHMYLADTLSRAYLPTTDNQENFGEDVLKLTDNSSDAEKDAESINALHYISVSEQTLTKIKQTTEDDERTLDNGESMAHLFQLQQEAIGSNNAMSDMLVMGGIALGLHYGSLTVGVPPVLALGYPVSGKEDAAQNVNLPEVQNPPQGQNAPAADQNANAAGQPLECIPTMEERLKKLEDQGKANSVAMALQSLHRTLDKARFDADEALADLETLVRQAKVNNDPKAREFECVLDEVQRHSKTLSRTALKDLFVALVGDPVKSKILEKANKVLKNIGTLSDNPRPPAYNHGGPQPLMDLNNHGHPWPDRATASRRLPSWRENRRSPYARRPNMATHMLPV